MDVHRLEQHDKNSPLKSGIALTRRAVCFRSLCYYLLQGKTMRRAHRTLAPPNGLPTRRLSMGLLGHRTHDRRYSVVCARNVATLFTAAHGTLGQLSMSFEDITMNLISGLDNSLIQCSQISGSPILILQSNELEWIFFLGLALAFGWGP